MLRGFVKLKKFQKSEKKWVGGWVDQAPTRTFFLEMVCFFVLFFFVVHVSKKMDRRVVGGIWTMGVFLGFLYFF